MHWLHCIILLYSPTYHTVITSGVLRMQLTYRNWWYSRKKIIRIIAGMKHREPTANAFRELRIIKFLDVNKMLMGCFMYKYYHELLPDIFMIIFNVFEMCIIITPDKIMGCMPVTWKTDLGQTCIGYRGPVIWNKILGIQINPDTPEVSFKKALKQCIHNGLF